MKTKVHSSFTKLLVACLIALALPASAIAAAGTSNQAVDAAKNWLAVIDVENMSRAGTRPCKLFQEHVTQAQWANLAKTARGPLGAVLSRCTPVVRFATSLPGVPDGNYAILQFVSKFAHKTAALETVTMMLQDGTWRAGGYFIK